MEHSFKTSQNSLNNRSIARDNYEIDRKCDVGIRNRVTISDQHLFIAIISSFDKNGPQKFLIF